MAGSLNKAQLIGHLGHDPDMRRTQDGRPIANFSVATTESWRDRNSGERRERTEWHRIVIFNEGLCGVAEKYLRKGSKVYLEGQIMTRKWEDKTGTERYTTEIVLQSFDSKLLMLDRQQNGPGRASGPGDYSLDNDRAAGPSQTGSQASSEKSDWERRKEEVAAHHAAQAEAQAPPGGGGPMSDAIDDDILF